MQPSPVEMMSRLSRELKIDLRIKRDDVLAVSGGGNKYRKLIRIFEDAGRKGCNAVVTTGGLQSNHARVTALMAAQRGWRCKLILHGRQSDMAHPSGNTFLMRLANAEIVITAPEAIAYEMDKAIRMLREDGLHPCEIPGGGHSLEGAMAYVEAIDELNEQCSMDKWRPDWIVHASGTGATQAGLIVGLRQLGWATRVLGISVARKNPRGAVVVAQSCMELGRHLNLTDISDQAVDFRDNWVGDGYEKAGQDVFSAIHLAARTEGVILDPTYTGKAFSALLDLVKSGEIKIGSRVLFWHTGGLLNLIASNYTKDILQS